jgi:hypothetical protein
MDLFETAISITIYRSMAFILARTPSCLCTKDDKSNSCVCRPPSRVKVTDSFRCSSLHLWPGNGLSGAMKQQRSTNRFLSHLSTTSDPENVRPAGI